jgi:hypothetical protein
LIALAAAVAATIASVGLSPRAVIAKSPRPVS